MDKSKKGVPGSAKVGPDGRPLTVNSTSPSKHMDRTGSYSDVMNSKVQKSTETQDQDDGGDTSSETGKGGEFEFLADNDDSNEFYELNAQEDQSAPQTHAASPCNLDDVKSGQNALDLNSCEF